jgi:hypothetical protein
MARAGAYMARAGAYMARRHAHGPRFALAFYDFILMRMVMRMELF